MLRCKISVSKRFPRAVFDMLIISELQICFLKYFRKNSYLLIISKLCDLKVCNLVKVCKTLIFSD